MALRVPHDPTASSVVAREVSSSQLPVSRKRAYWKLVTGNRTTLWVTVTAVLLSPLILTSQAQSPGRPAIQTPGGGRGPGAAPEANDPANANADLSPKPPVLPVSPIEQAKRFCLPARYRFEPVRSGP